MRTQADHPLELYLLTAVLGVSLLFVAFSSALGPLP